MSTASAHLRMERRCRHRANAGVVHWIGLAVLLSGACASAGLGTSVPDAGAETDAPAGDAHSGSTDAAAPDAAPVLGMSWPEEQVFPSFAPLAPLDVVDGTAHEPEVMTLLVTLQGLVNRTQPRIYVPDGGDGDRLWLEELGVPTTTVDDPLELVSKYRAEIAGMVIYDDTQIDTLNLATTIAGLQDGVVASPALAETLAAAPYSLAVLEDLRDRHFGSNLEVYAYELEHYAPSACHRLIIGLRPGIAGHLRDYAVATRAMMVWLDPQVPAERELLGQFFELLPFNAPYLGWWKAEGAGVDMASTYGVPVYAADWSTNLTVLGGSPRGSAAVPPPPSRPALENKVYVAIFMSDGDNLQEDQHLIPLKWANAHRGSVPIAWTINPALVDVAPVILRYFQRTATARDVLVSGPSGLGYTYPAAWPSGGFVEYAKKSGEYMEAAGLRMATVWNHGADLGEADAHAYVEHVPGLLGLTVQEASQALRMLDDKVPLVRMALSYGDSSDILIGGIESQLGSFDGSRPLFLAVQGNMNMGPINPAAFFEVQQHFAHDTDVVFVRPDHFFQLLFVSEHPAQHRLFDGDFTGDGKADQLFYYAGDGNWWLGASDGSELAWHLASNVAALGNLLDGQHGIYTGDSNGDGATDVLLYDASDDSWRIGEASGTTLSWRSAGSGAGVSGLLDGRHRVLVNDYTGDGRDDILVYGAADGTWRLGVSAGDGLAWHLAGDTAGFGNLLDGSHAMFDGDWNGDGRADVLMYYNGDGHWWMGVSDGNALSWHLASETAGFGNLIDSSHRLLAGDWNGDGTSDMLFHYNGDGNWWMGISNGDSISWELAGVTDGFGDLLDPYHRMFVVDHDGDGRADVMVYDSGSGTWRLGRSSGAALTWESIDDTSGFGDLVAPDRHMSLGDYDGDGRTDALFYYAGDGNWWLRPAAASPLGWQLAGNTSGFGDLTR